MTHSRGTGRSGICGWERQREREGGREIRVFFHSIRNFMSPPPRVMVNNSRRLLVCSGLPKHDLFELTSLNIRSIQTVGSDSEQVNQSPAYQCVGHNKATVMRLKA